MFAASKTASVSGGYQISRSLRFNSADSAYLARTPASASNQQIWTINTWVKRSKLGTLQTLLRVSGVPFVLIDFTADDKFSVDIYNGSVEYILKTTQVFRDVSAWGMMTIAVDTTQATASNRVKIYWNGVQITSFVTADYPPQNNNTALNSTAITYIGGNVPSSNQFTDFYLTEFNLIDGQQLTPSSFGETNTDTGVWQPKFYAGTYGTNGFYLNFSDNSNTTAATLGKDYSGNGNNWTPNNFSVTAGAGNDSLVDSPTSYGVDTGAGGEVRGNYATWNPLKSDSSTSTYQDGNLQVTFPSGAAGGIATATMAVSSGKFYWEITVGGTDGNTQPKIGVISPTVNTQTSASVDIGDYGYAYGRNGNKSILGTVTAYGASFTTGDVIGFALDMDAGTLVCYKNNSSQGTLVTGLSGLLQPGITAYNGYIQTANFGQRPFAYTAPSGFKALCTQNLPTPTIGATSATLANKYIDVVLRTGAGGGTYSTTVNMANGALLWDKPRNQASSHFLFDSVRGISKTLSSNLTNAENTYTTWYTNFGSSSYTTGAGDWSSPTTLVDWIWAAGTGASNTTGSITSTVGVSATSGFSIVTYTGTGLAGTIGHGLGVAPAMIIVKSRSATGDWPVYHTSIGNSSNLLLNSTAATASSSTIWNATSPTSSVFSVGINTDSNTITVTYVAYCFAEIAGYSKFGTYTGNGSADGPFVFTGMRPAFILYKRSDTGGNSWRITDSTRSTYNLDDTAFLYPDASSSENDSANDALDILSNGFKIRTANAPSNASSSTYIFMAFASNPFKYSLAR